MTLRVLVTGGAGYIGSHMVKVLLAASHEVVVVDSLVTGHRDAVDPRAEFVGCDVGDKGALDSVLRRGGFDAVVHFAARSQVGESVVHPRMYYTNNLAAGLSFLEMVLDAKIPIVVLSSTAAVYGNPAHLPLEESHRTEPINPYGESKLVLEKVLASYHAAYGLRFAALRYFNAAGASPAEGLGERHEPESHLIPIVLDAALGKRPHVAVFGTDYPTPDGTCIRDYIHVLDLCDAHLRAIEHLHGGGESGAFNLGTGTGYSVREVIQMAERVTGRSIPVVYGDRRAGDPPELVAAVAKATRVLGLTSTRSSLKRIVADAWAWHTRL